MRSVVPAGKASVRQHVEIASPRASTSSAAGLDDRREVGSKRACSRRGRSQQSCRESTAGHVADRDSILHRRPSRSTPVVGVRSSLDCFEFAIGRGVPRPAARGRPERFPPRCHGCIAPESTRVRLPRYRKRGEHAYLASTLIARRKPEARRLLLDWRVKSEIGQVREFGGRVAGHAIRCAPCSLIATVASHNSRVLPLLEIAITTSLNRTWPRLPCRVSSRQKGRLRADRTQQARRVNARRARLADAGQMDAATRASGWRIMSTAARICRSISRRSVPSSLRHNSRKTADLTEGSSAHWLWRCLDLLAAPDRASRRGNSASHFLAHREADGNAPSRPTHTAPAALASADRAHGRPHLSPPAPRPKTHRRRRSSRQP